MLSDYGYRPAGLRKNHHNPLRELAVADHRNFGFLTDLDLLQNIEGCRKRFDKHCLVVADGIGKRDEVARRQRQEFCKRAVSAVNSQHCALCAMSGITLTAQIA